MDVNARGTLKSAVAQPARAAGLRGKFNQDGGWPTTGSSRAARAPILAARRNEDEGL
jgi:hypothetical protein